MRFDRWEARTLPKVESEAQSIVADIRIYEGILMNVPAVIYCFLAGANHNKMTKQCLKEQLFLQDGKGRHS